MEVKCQALTQGSFDIIQLHQPPPPHHSTELNIFWGKDHLLLNTVLSLHSSEICGLCLMIWPSYKCFKIWHYFSNAKTHTIFFVKGNVLLGLFINHKPLISEECLCSNLKRLKVKDHEMQQKDRQISHSDYCSEIFLVWQPWLKEKVWYCTLALF